MNLNPSERSISTCTGAGYQETLAAAMAGNSAAFATLTEPFRKELTTHCYRMLGSLEDAEDQVQESYLRAWRALQTFQGRGSLRAWLYKIATNTCLDVLAQRPRRGLPVQFSPPSDPSRPLKLPVNDPIWLQPYPDELAAPLITSPEARYDANESISLAFMVALQELPPRQRCALILGDVLEWQATEIAEALGISVSAVNSLLHRARSILKQRYKPSAEEKPRLSEEGQRKILEQYITAWAAADIDRIVSMLTEEATFPMPPLPSWYQGRDAIRKFIQATSLAGEAAGRWKLVAIRANGLPGFAFYQREEVTGRYLPFALQVLSFDGELISDVTTFGNPELFPTFNLPAELAG